MKKLIPAFILGVAVLVAGISAKQFNSATADRDSVAVLSTVEFQGPSPCYPLPACQAKPSKKLLKDVKK